MSKRLRWAGHVAGIEEGRANFKMLTSKAKFYKSKLYSGGNRM